MVSFSDQPTEFSESEFPRLNSANNYEHRSPTDENYNCIAYAAGDTERWWWPDSLEGGYYWPSRAPRESSVAAFEKAFESVGYELCSDEMPEEGFDKIVIYAKGDAPTHAARQEASTNMWLSKLGQEIDIAHNTVEDVGGGIYGEPVRYLRRPVPQKAG